MDATNPLLALFETPPFDQIEPEHFAPAIREGIELARHEIDAITEQSDRPDFTNTIAALDASGERLGLVSDIFFNLNSAETNDTLQALARELSPEITAFQNDVSLNPALFARVKEVWENRDQETLSPEQQTLLEKTYLRFVRNGALLDAEKQQELREIDVELSRLSLTFGEHVLAETNDYELHLTDEDDLKGLPDPVRQEAAETAKERGKTGWIFTLHAPSYVPFITYAENRSLRETLMRAYGQRAFRENEQNNEQTVRALVDLRRKRAQLLGYDTHAVFVLERRMAQTPETVTTFLSHLREKALSAAEKDVKAVQALAKELDGIEDLKRWDFAYYSEKLRKQLFDLDDELLRPYFALEQVIQGAFATAGKLYGIRFESRDDIAVYHPDVSVYEVLDKDGTHLSLLYADFFPRAGKRAGAWMTSFRGQYFQNDLEKRPQISIVCNFTKPTADLPSLLTFNEVKTLFHEFGHALHGMLAKGRYGSLTGTHVFWDFVELPSQVMENWCYEKECLDLFAKHHETGEPFPEEWLQRLKASAQFQEGYQTIRQLSFGLLDMAWHHRTGGVEDVRALEAEALASTQVLPPVSDTNTSCQFSHIFQGGYSAGYYSYKWAEVLDADAFERFQEAGIFNSEVAQAFRTHILEAGGSEHPQVLYERFRGKAPDPDALLRRAGLL
ncbi:MAG: M3 family metallopeptidase [Leptolyngbya sp. SIO3F4]|nr:M3 family metallopeptidase [Leptolyngbya sp. SIO3F4]